MDDAFRLRINHANVAGGRLVDPASPTGYDPADRTDVFADALAAGRPHILTVSELDAGRGSRQLERLADRSLGSGAHREMQPWSDSHIPGVRNLGVGIASVFPLLDVERLRLPDPPFEALHWRTGERFPWHAKGMVVARCETPAGDVHIVAGQVHPVHMARTRDGVEYSYNEGAGREFGRSTAAFLSERLAERGIERAVIVGDLNMPDPRAFFTRVGDTALVDVFGPGTPPATTPDGRSIDRAFVTEDLRPAGHRVVPLDGADHFPVFFEVEVPRRPAAAPKGRALGLGDTPAMTPERLTEGRAHPPAPRPPAARPATAPRRLGG
jgi:endonuclease/exonuclease/phosphatase family metal-dependent hydrolase